MLAKALRKWAQRSEACVEAFVSRGTKVPGKSTMLEKYTLNI